METAAQSIPKIVVLLASDAAAGTALLGQVLGRLERAGVRPRRRHVFQAQAMQAAATPEQLAFWASEASSGESIGQRLDPRRAAAAETT